MSTDSNLSETIKENTQLAKKAKGDNGEMEQHSLKDQIEADRYLCNKEAAKRGPGALKLTRLIPPGSA